MVTEVRPSRLLAALTRRADYLCAQIMAREANSYDKAEHTALRWALEELQQKYPQPQGRKPTK